MLAVGVEVIHMEGWDVMRVVDQSVAFVVRVFILTVQPQQQPLRQQLLQQRVFYLAQNLLPHILNIIKLYKYTYLTYHHQQTFAAHARTSDPGDPETRENFCYARTDLESG